MNELIVLWAALLAYVVAGSIAIVAVVLKRLPERSVLALILLGLALHTVSIAMRWERLGHGPFITMFEILSSNIWSMMLAFAIAYWRLPPIRPSSAVVMPILFIVMGWLMMTNPGEGHLPPTYHTIWLYIHIGFGKVFFGAVLVATGISGVILLRPTAFGAGRFERLPADSRLSELTFRCMAIGFIFETLMLIAGAIWAQDAWGRYWAWDPLETWAFLTWLVLAFSLHARFTLKLSPRAGAILVVAVFIVAFLTFFGVPFISTSPHKGAI
ncbi:MULTISPECIES: cytochrome c biogenesis protein CcsA [Oxalobacteraceae]|jgi:cytochrome c-type biogenesis protein CcsB|uniref:cytochrome c biogenesis protein CcsA n=1 Tax=Oxalobacteraceae TaxID=75682 RepID=UPI0010A4949A|nr:MULTISPECIES: cytochrome c biogenesis protein CcsA [Oxalobacteraceae]